MTIDKRFPSIFLSMTLALGPWLLDGCGKSDSNQAPTQSGQGQQAQQAPPTTAAVPSADELYQLVAPIALFPDNLVAQVLAGSTFPDQISAANTWLKQNSGLKGDQLMQAVDQQSWDVSVKALTQFPDVLNQMATNLTWTSSLGDAYFNVPQSVMNAVQVMRKRAYDAGNLKTNQQQNISVENQAPSAAPAPASSGAPQTTIVQAPPQTIIIQPSQPQVVYVPTYNPTVVYGAPVPAPPGYSTGAMVATSLISFGLGIAVGAAIANNNSCCGWGYNSWGCGWHSSTVVYNRNVYVSNSNTFVNRNNYYRGNNVNNVNVNNVNRNNLNQNNVNRNNINQNNVNRNNVNNRANNFNNNGGGRGSTPNFGEKYNQPQFKDVNGANLAQNNRQQPGAAQNNRQQLGANPNNRQQLGGATQNARQPAAASQPKFDQQNRAGGQQAQNRPSTMNQTQRQPARGYDQQPSRNTSSGAFSGYSPGGNARTNSARGEQSLSGGRGGGGGGATRSQPAAARGGQRR